MSSKLFLFLSKRYIFLWIFCSSIFRLAQASDIKITLYAKFEDSRYQVNSLGYVCGECDNAGLIQACRTLIFKLSLYSTERIELCNQNVNWKAISSILVTPVWDNEGISLKTGDSERVYYFDQFKQMTKDNSLEPNLFWSNLFDRWSKFDSFLENDLESRFERSKDPSWLTSNRTPLFTCLCHSSSSLSNAIGFINQCAFVFDHLDNANKALLSQPKIVKDEISLEGKGQDSLEPEKDVVVDSNKVDKENSEDFINIEPEEVVEKEVCLLKREKAFLSLIFGACISISCWCMYKFKQQYKLQKKDNPLRQV